MSPVACRRAEKPVKNRIAPRTSTTMPAITQLVIAAAAWLNPRTHGEMIIQMPNSALIPDNQFISSTSNASVHDPTEKSLFVH